MAVNIWRDLSPEEENDFRQWARENYKPGWDDIHPLWHPVVKDECRIMDEEASMPCSECGKLISRENRDGICYECQCFLHSLGAFDMDGEGWVH